MKPFILPRAISQETLAYFAELFSQIPAPQPSSDPISIVESGFQVTFTTGERFFVQIESVDKYWITRLYEELGLNFDVDEKIAAIVSSGIIPRHNDFSKDKTTIVNVGIKGVSATKTIFYCDDEEVVIQYEPGQAFCFDPKVDHEVAWRDQPAPQHRISLTLKFYESPSNFAGKLT